MSFWWRRPFRRAADCFADLVERSGIEIPATPFTCYGEEQTIVALRQLLRTAARKRVDVDIIGGDFPAPIYDPLIPDLENCLKAGCYFRILTSVPLADERLAANQFMQKALQQGEARQLVAEHRRCAHFMLVEDFGYWLKTDPQFLDGTACLSDTRGIITTRLIGAFDVAARAAGLGVRPAVGAGFVRLEPGPRQGS